LADRRDPLLPDVPTMKESGLRDFRPAANLALVGPAGLPKPIVERLYSEMVRAAASPEVLATYQSTGFERTVAPADEYSRIVKQELESWGPLIRELNITQD
jgi:tripartite-type tricarboxylate transporter receptor subunit TctC